MTQQMQAPQRAKKTPVVIEKLTATTLKVDLPLSGLLPARKGRPLGIFPGDNPDTMIPVDDEHQKVRELCKRLKPGSGSIDHLRLKAQKTKLVFEVQLHGLDTKGVESRFESALQELDFEPRDKY